MTIEEATKIATGYCNKHFEKCTVTYNGLFEQCHTFKVSFGLSGHIGIPVIVNVSNNGTPTLLTGQQQWKAFLSSLQ